MSFVPQFLCFLCLISHLLSSLIALIIQLLIISCYYLCPSFAPIVFPPATHSAKHFHFIFSVVLFCLTLETLT